MLDVLDKHLNAGPETCSVADWIASLSIEEQDAFNKIKENNKEINIATLYKDLTESIDLPFKLTLFRSHLRGYCICQK